MKPFKFFVITDTHYFDEKLGCSGDEYEKFMQFEQKCFAETAAINESVFKWLGNSDEADTVLIAGDLSFNGEKQSHLKFIKLLKKLQKSGKRVFVITAGHDFGDDTFCFDENGKGHPEGTKREELFDLYYEFGFSDALSVHKESLSYVTEIGEHVRLFALNNDGNYMNPKTYTSSQIEWILRETKKGRAAGDVMIAMNHYPLIPASPVLGLVGDAVMKNADNITKLLADEGVHVCFTGHMHNQSIKSSESENGNIFWDICTGSIIGCPAFMRLCEIKDEHTLEVKSIPVPDFSWDKDGLSNEQYLRRQFDMMINTYLDCMENDPERLLGKLGIPENEMIEKIVGFFGETLNSATVGSVCKKLFVKCDSSVEDRPLRDFITEIVRNIFVGNAPYVEGTPEYEAFMGVAGRFNPVLSLIKKTVKVKGEPLDIKNMLRNTIGNYGVDEYDTVLRF